MWRGSTSPTPPQWRGFEDAGSALGTPDILIANAGVALSRVPVAEWDDARFEDVIRTDLMGPLHRARAFVGARSDREGGRVVFIGSVAGHLSTAESAPYGGRG